MPDSRSGRDYLIKFFDRDKGFHPDILGPEVEGRFRAMGLLGAVTTSLETTRKELAKGIANKSFSINDALDFLAKDVYLTEEDPETGEKIKNHFLRSQMAGLRDFEDQDIADILSEGPLETAISTAYNIATMPDQWAAQQIIDGAVATEKRKAAGKPINKNVPSTIYESLALANSFESGDLIVKSAELGAIEVTKEQKKAALKRVFDISQETQRRYMDKLNNDPEFRAYVNWKNHEDLLGKPREFGFLWYKYVADVMSSGLVSAGVYIAAQAVGGVGLGLLAGYGMEASGYFTESINYMLNEREENQKLMAEGKDYSSDALRTDEEIYAIANHGSIMYGVVSTIIENMGIRWLTKGMRLTDEAFGGKFIMKRLVSKAMKDAKNLGSEHVVKTMLKTGSGAAIRHIVAPGFFEGLEEVSQLAAEQYIKSNLEGRQNGFELLFNKLKNGQSVSNDPFFAELRDSFFGGAFVGIGLGAGPIASNQKARSEQLLKIRQNLAEMEDVDATDKMRFYAHSAAYDMMKEYGIDNFTPQQRKQFVRNFIDGVLEETPRFLQDIRAENESLKKKKKARKKKEETKTEEALTSEQEAEIIKASTGGAVDKTATQETTVTETQTEEKPKRVAKKSPDMQAKPDTEVVEEAPEAGQSGPIVQEGGEDTSKTKKTAEKPSFSASPTLTSLRGKVFKAAGNEKKAGKVMDEAAKLGSNQGREDINRLFSEGATEEDHLAVQKEKEDVQNEMTFVQNRINEIEGKKESEVTLAEKKELNQLETYYQALESVRSEREKELAFFATGGKADDTTLSIMTAPNESIEKKSEEDNQTHLDNILKLNKAGMTAEELGKMTTEQVAEAAAKLPEFVEEQNNEAQETAVTPQKDNTEPVFDLADAEKELRDIEREITDLNIAKNIGKKKIDEAEYSEKMTKLEERKKAAGEKVLAARNLKNEKLREASARIEKFIDEASTPSERIERTGNALKSVDIRIKEAKANLKEYKDNPDATEALTKELEYYEKHKAFLQKTLKEQKEIQKQNIEAQKVNKKSDKDYDPLEDDQDFSDDYDNKPKYQNIATGKLRILENQKLADKISMRLALHYPNISQRQVQQILDENGVEMAGRAFGSIAEWSKKGTVDTPPHEHFHLIMNVIREDPIIREALEKFDGDEEALVEAVGMYYAKRANNEIPESSIKYYNWLHNWLRKFWGKIKKIFGQLSKDDIVGMLGESFYRGEILSSIRTDVEFNDMGAPLSPNGNISKLPIDIYFKVRDEAFIKKYGDWITPAKDTEYLKLFNKIEALLKLAVTIKEFDITLIYNAIDKFESYRQKMGYDSTIVVDENGEPLIMYHGSSVMFEEFDSSYFKTGEGAMAFGSGFYFTDKFDTAVYYSKIGLNRANRLKDKLSDDDDAKARDLNRKIVKLVRDKTTNDSIDNLVLSMFDQLFHPESEIYDKMLRRQKRALESAQEALDVYNNRDNIDYEAFQAEFWLYRFPEEEIAQFGLKFLLEEELKIKTELVRLLELKNVQDVFEEFNNVSYTKNIFTSYIIESLRQENILGNTINPFYKMLRSLYEEFKNQKNIIASIESSNVLNDYFSTEKQINDLYKEIEELWLADNSHITPVVYPVFLNVRNAVYWEGYYKNKDGQKVSGYAQYQNSGFSQSQSYDAVVHYTRSGERHVIVYKSSNVKSIFYKKTDHQSNIYYQELENDSGNNAENINEESLDEEMDDVLTDSDEFHPDERSQKFGDKSSLISNVLKLDVLSTEAAKTDMRIMAFKSGSFEAFYDQFIDYIDENFPEAIQYLPTDDTPEFTFQNWLAHLRSHYNILKNSMFLVGEGERSLTDKNFKGQAIYRRSYIYMVNGSLIGANKVKGVPGKPGLAEITGWSDIQPNTNLVTKKRFPGMEYYSFYERQLIDPANNMPIEISFINDARVFDYTSNGYWKKGELDLDKIDSQLNATNWLFFFGIKGGSSAMAIIGRVPQQMRHMTNEEASMKLESMIGTSITEEQYNVILDDSQKRTNGMIKALARVLLFEQVKYPGYLKSFEADTIIGKSPIRVTMDRLKIDFAQGRAAFGIPNQKIMIIDDKIKIRVGKSVYAQKQFYRDNETGEGEELDMTDGWAITGQKLFDAIGDDVGFVMDPNGNRMTHMKAFIRHRSENGDYIGMKMMNMSAFKGMEFIDSKGNVIAKEKNGQFVDAEGNVFDIVATDNEAKQTNGAFSERNKIASRELSGTDFRILHMQKSRSKPGVVSMMQWYDQLYHNDPAKSKALKEFMDSIKKYIDTVTEQWVQALVDMHNNPKKIRDFLYRSAEEGSYEYEIQKILEADPSGKILMTPGYQKIINQILFNRIISKNLYRGRHKNGGLWYIKPMGHLDFKRDEFAVSSDNQVTWNIVVKDMKRFLLSKGKEGEKQAFLFDKRPRNEQIAMVNKYLEKKEFSFVMARFPINKATAVIMRRLKMFVEPGHGDTVFLHPLDVDRTEGDYDGDKVFVDYSTPDMKKAFIKAEKDGLFNGRNYRIKIGDYVINHNPATSASISDTITESQGMIVGSDNIGKVVTAKTTASTMAFKNAKVTIQVGNDIIEITAVNPNEVRTIPYLVVQGNNMQRVEQLPFEHEMSILLQIAVDDAKFGLWSQILEGHSIEDFLASRAYRFTSRKISENPESAKILTPEVVMTILESENPGLKRAVSALIKTFSMSQVRNNSARFQDGAQWDVSQHYDFSQRLYTAISNKKIDSFYKRNFMDNISFAKLIDLTTNSEVTATEHAIAKLGEAEHRIYAEEIVKTEIGKRPVGKIDYKYEHYYGNYLTPVMRSPEYNAVLHNATMTIIQTELKNGNFFNRKAFDDLMIPDSFFKNDLDAFMYNSDTNFAEFQKFWTLARKRQYGDSRGAYREARETWIQKFESWSEAEQIAFTLRYLATVDPATGERNSGNEIAYVPAELLHMPTMVAYADIVDSLSKEEKVNVMAIINNSNTIAADVILNAMAKKRTRTC